MKKNLIALAVGATVAAAPIVATQADVKLWGRLEVELVSTDGGDIDELKQGDANGMSRFGIDASKDLGNGLKAVGRYAFKMDPSNGADLSARDQWVGLKGGFGAVLFGRQPTAYKMNGGVKWDPYVATFMEARRSGGMSGDASGHNGFMNDIITYASPKFGGVKFQANYIADDTDGVDGTYSVGGTGDFGPISVIAAYSGLKSEGAETKNQAKVGVRYKANGLTAAIQYEDVDKAGSIRANGNKVAGAGEASILFANLGYKFGNTLISGSYGKTDADNNGQDVDYAAIGARYYFAKKVSAYIGYAVNESDNKYKMFGGGMRYDF